MEATTTNASINNSQIADSTHGQCPHDPPSINDYLPGLSKEYSIAFGVLGVLTFVLVVNYLEELHYLYHHHSPLQARARAKWLLCLYPITALTSLLTLLAPRLSYVNDLVATMYVCLCVHVFVVMIIEQYGGPVKMFRQLRGRALRLNPTPLCCCACLPKYSVRRVHLQIIHAMVLQFVIIRPIISYIVTVMWSDGTFGSVNNAMISPQTYIQVVNVVSTFISMYGFVLVKDQSKKLLSNINIGPKFYILQLVLLIIGVQRSVVLFVIVILKIPCLPPLNFESTVDRYNHMITICEMAVLGAVARFYYRHTAQAVIGQIAAKYRRKTTSFLVELERHKVIDEQPEIIYGRRSTTTSESTDTVKSNDLDDDDETEKAPPKTDVENNEKSLQKSSKRERKISFEQNYKVELSFLEDSVVTESPLVV